jgi:hypothetical protein
VLGGKYKTGGKMSNNPYFVRALYFVLGAIAGAMLAGCGGSGVSNPGTAELIMQENADGTATFTCVGYTDVSECLALLKGNDGADGVNGVDGANGADGTDGIDGIDGEDGENGEDCTKKPKKGKGPKKK